MQKPALMLPMGKKEYEQGGRMNFLRSFRWVLDKLGWCVGIEAKGADLCGWGKDCFKEIQSLGGRITWHPPQKATRRLHHGIDEQLAEIAEAANRYRKFGLEAVTIHLAPALSVEPPEDAGLERYDSPIGAVKMLVHIESQVEPLKQLNELMGGILQIENVDIIQFRGGGYRVPTYLALQTGCWQDILWLKEQAGVNTTFDSEHFFCARNFLTRQNDFADLGREYEPASIPLEIAGYVLEKGKPPLSKCKISLGQTIEERKPRLFHLGGATRAVDDEGRISTHLPSFSDPVAKKALDEELCWIMSSRSDVIGAVIEVTGQLDTDKYSEWSPRTKNDEIAKQESYLEVIKAIEQQKN